MPNAPNITNRKNIKRVSRRADITSLINSIIPYFFTFTKRFIYSNKGAIENLVHLACALIKEVGIFLKAFFPHPRDLTLRCYVDMFDSQGRRAFRRLEVVESDHWPVDFFVTVSTSDDECLIPPTAFTTFPNPDFLFIETVRLSSPDQFPKGH